MKKRNKHIKFYEHERIWKFAISKINLFVHTYGNFKKKWIFFCSQTTGIDLRENRKADFIRSAIQVIG